MKFAKIAKYWHRYCLLVCLILLGYGLVKTFSPNIKIVEKIKVIVDTKEVEKAKSEISLLNNTISTMTKAMARLKKVNADIQSDTIIVEIIHPDGRIERRTEIKVTDTSSTEISSSSSEIEESSTTISSTVIESTDTITTIHSDTDTLSTTEENPIPFWSTIVGYQYKDNQYLIGQGVNIGQHFTMGILSSYKHNVSDNVSRWDVGAMVIVRY